MFVSKYNLFRNSLSLAKKKKFSVLDQKVKSKNYNLEKVNFFNGNR